MKKVILAVFLLAAVRPAMATEAVQTGGESGVGIYKAGEITVSGKKSGSAETVSAAEMEKLGKQTLSEA
ncbi:MAG: TonB-dependent receptor, partial [Chlorobiales bacterium]|nr:TonB-dependent receptor [Chlorobiales bacterium]